MRWSGTIRPGTVYNDMCSHYDLMPTFAAAGGNPNIAPNAPPAVRSVTRPSRCTSMATISSPSSRET